MGTKSYTIGEVARLGGVTVRRIRFYSDKGLLPPADRTASNYRLYTDLDLARLDLIRALRDAGLDLATIGRLLGRKMSLAEALRTRLDMLEAEIAAKQRIAAALRATLRSSDPDDIDLRRLWTMTHLSNAQMKTLATNFVDRIMRGAVISDEWRQRMIAGSVPELPDEPTKEQIEAWNELAGNLADEKFIESLVSTSENVWDGSFDPEAYKIASECALAETQSAIARKLDPASLEGEKIARRWLEGAAKARSREPDAAILDWLLGQYATHHARSARYRELIAILRGEDGAKSANEAWVWMNAALAALRGRIK